MSETEEDVADGVVVRETGKGKFQQEVRAGGLRFLADEPQSASGSSSGPNPYELLAAALGACTSMTLRLYAERKGWALTNTTVRVLHRREASTGKDRFAREIVLEGDLSPDQRQRMLEIANRCPVHQTLEGGSQIVTVLSQAQDIGRLDPLPSAHLADMDKACED